ncbi:UbiA family prenyltransferase, partial [Flavobacteriales bacterium]|nr:UbiA family prenyltransferase [Flavobacteriales bacterium]
LRFVDDKSLSGRRRWVVRNTRMLTFITAISSLIAGYFAMILSLKILMFLLPVALISVGYSIPVFFGKRLRDFPTIKIYLIAIVVALVVVVLPAMGKEVLIDELFMLLVVQVLFILGITIPFDIRDINVDTNDLKTIPILLGVRNSKILAMLLLFSCSVISVIFLRDGIGIAASGLIAIIPVWYSGPDRGDYYFPLLLEGMMILQFLFVLTCS